MNTGGGSTDSGRRLVVAFVAQVESDQKGDQNSQEGQDAGNQDLFPVSECCNAESLECLNRLVRALLGG